MKLQLRSNSANYSLLQSSSLYKQPQNNNQIYRTISPCKIIKQDLVTINQKQNNQVLHGNMIQTVNIKTQRFSSLNKQQQILQYTITQPQTQNLVNQINQNISQSIPITSSQNNVLNQKIVTRYIGQPQIVSQGLVPQGNSRTSTQIIQQKITVLQQAAPKQVLFSYPQNQKKKIIVHQIPLQKPVPVVYQSPVRTVLIQYPTLQEDKEQLKPLSEVNFTNMKIEPKKKLIKEYNLQSNPLSLRSPIRKLQSNETLTEAQEEYEDEPEEPMRALDKGLRQRLKKIQTERPRFRRDKRKNDDDLERRFNEAVQRARDHRQDGQQDRGSQKPKGDEPLEGNLALQYGDGYFYNGQGIPPQTRHGSGILTDPQGNQLYAGNWKNNLYHGEGKLCNPNPQELNQPLNYYDLSEFQLYWASYEGQFQDGIIEGYGTIYFSNGEKYEGEFVDGMIEGKGKFFLKDQSYFEGDWQAGLLIQV